MKSPFSPKARARRSNSPLAASLFTLSALFSFALALALSAGSALTPAYAAPESLSVAQPVTATATITASEVLTEVAPTLPAAVPTVPATTPVAGETMAVPEGIGTPPVPVRTNEAGEPIIPPPTPVPSPRTDNVNDQGITPGVEPGAQPGSSSQGGGGFPWWPLALIGLAALVGVGFMLFRTRPPATVEVTRETRSRPTTTARVADPVAGTKTVEAPADDVPTARLDAQESEMEVGGVAPDEAEVVEVEPVEGATAEVVAPEVETTPVVMAEPDALAPTVTPAVPPPVVPPLTITTATAPPIVAEAATPAGGPSEVTCPNCGTANSIEENFCHECGEDLRPVRAAAVAATAPAVTPEVDIDTLPYLETLDRVDEQLEYVLSRPRVLIGSAPGNDIVINADFNGNESVSRVHAELRQDAGNYILRDRDSERGTYVNDARTGESVLADGDRIRLGEVKFVFRVPES